MRSINPDYLAEKVDIEKLDDEATLEAEIVDDRASLLVDDDPLPTPSTPGRSQMMTLPVRASPKGKQIAGVNESQLSDTDALTDSQPEFDWEIYGR